MDIFRTLIVPDAFVELARQIAASFGQGGAGMWTSPLSANGKEPAKYWISTGYVPPEYEYLIPCQTWKQGKDGVWIITGSAPGDPVAVYTTATSQGVKCTQADVDALFAASDVTTQEPFTAMGRLGVQIINPPDI
jgi:hypothetical protein